MYRGKYHLWQGVCCLVIILGVCPLIRSEYSDADCSGNGVFKNETCVCYDGWQGTQCQYCGGKVRLENSTGIITSGLGSYPTEIKWTWLIEASNTSITLHLDDFATECGWDYLYIFDGDSVDSPLLGVFSGLMYKGHYSIRRVPEVVATSGSALVHFFSDPALNMSGFNMTYRLNACPSNISGVDCSGNGVCTDGTCICNKGWTGEACHFEKCPNDCGKSEGRGVCEPEYGCKCSGDYKGNDCSQVAVKGYWETISPENFVAPGSASHGAAVWGDSMYITAGESYNRSYIMLRVYDFNGNVWGTLYSYESPSSRYGHSTVIYGDKIFLYGGDLGNRGPTSELWSFDINTKTWENITVKAETCNASYLMCGPLKSAGHTATVVTNSTNKKVDRMVVLFGHSPNFGYLNIVQEFYFDTREWHIVNTTGYPVKGGYGHSAAWDPLTEKIYVYGGIISESESVTVLSNELYSYDPNTRVWTRLKDAPSARFLHTASFLSGGLMVVFGGNTYNDTLHSFNAKCYSSEFLAYDVTCDTWQVLQVPKDIQADLARFGHSAAVFEGSLYIYGGFDGQILSDMLKYTPGQCSLYNTSDSCLSTRLGVKCVWNTRSNVCVAIKNISRNLTIQSDDSIEWCPKSLIKQSIRNMEKCEKLKDCLSCVQTPSECDRKKCGNNLKSIITKLEQCRSLEPTIPTSICKQLHTCSACTSESVCGWTLQRAKCVDRSLTPNLTPEVVEPIQCPKVCSEHDSCLNCTQQDCIWCQNEGRCVDTNAYIASFPYGQCRDWTNTENKCHTTSRYEDSQCSFYSTCAKCREDPACGWCDDGSKTGLGKCMPGGNAGPTLDPYSLPLSTCPTDRWHFTTCPLCQCSGHASCVTNTSTCLPCSNLTMGDQCENCIKGYWGDANNGGKCQACECNNQASECNLDSGKCYCTTKGFIGDHCDKCDEGNYYKPDPITKKSCYYNVTTDYQYTFNMSKKEDKYYTQINFLNSPIKADIDVDFSITCSALAKLNITVRTGDSTEERSIFEGQNCTSFKTRFSKSEYPFGIEDNQVLTTFYVYVYDFQTPIWVQISFVQYPTLHLKPSRIFYSWAANLMNADFDEKH